MNKELLSLTSYVTGVIDNLSSYYLPAANILSGFEKTIKTEVKCIYT
ncbi:hypothetical protein [Rickettsia asiatica]|nr:hypothetical protein [Rickettsia asiatica]